MFTWGLKWTTSLHCKKTISECARFRCWQRRRRTKRRGNRIFWPPRRLVRATVVHIGISRSFSYSVLVWCLPACVLFVQLYDVCLTVWFLPSCIMSAQLCHVCLPCMRSAYLNGVCSSVLYCMISAHLNTWCLPVCMMLAYLYDCFLTIWCFPILNIG